MKKLLIILLILVTFFISFKIFAQTTETLYLNLDYQTIIKGYTAQSVDENFKIGIPAYAFSRATLLKIDDISNENFIIPDNLKLVSAVYLFDFDLKPVKTLDLSIKYNSYNALLKKIYSWDNNQKQWHELISQDLGNKIISARVPFKYARIAVLEEKITAENQLNNFITAKSAIVMDAKTGSVLFKKDVDTPRPIASLTKLMTAIIFLKYNPGWDNAVAITKDDDSVPSKIYIDDGDTLKISDLFYSMLVKSANNAANALARISGLSRGYFLYLMNLQAQDLGLGQTKFNDPAGLEPTNISTAYEYAQLTRQALKNPDIPQATTAATYEFKTLTNQEVIRLENTTKLFGSDLNITMTKTGYTYEAGNCLMVTAKNLATGRELIAVALDSKSGYLSADVYTLLDYYLNK